MAQSTRVEQYKRKGIAIKVLMSHCRRFPCLPPAIAVCRIQVALEWCASKLWKMMSGNGEGSALIQPGQSALSMQSPKRTRDNSTLAESGWDPSSEPIFRPRDWAEAAKRSHKRVRVVDPFTPLRGVILLILLLDYLPVTTQGYKLDNLLSAVQGPWSFTVLRTVKLSPSTPQHFVNYPIHLFLCRFLVCFFSKRCLTWFFEAKIYAPKVKLMVSWS